MTFSVAYLLALIASLSIAFIVIRGVRLTVARDLQRAIMQKQWSDTFFSHSKPLIEDADTPDETLQTLRLLTAMLGDRRSARALMAARDTLMSTSSKHTDLALEEASFYERRPELMCAYLAAIISGLLAAAYTTNYVDDEVRKRLLQRYESVHAEFVSTNSERLAGQIIGAVRDLAVENDRLGFAAAYAA